MKRTIYSVFLCLASCGLCVAQTTDPVILTIGEEAVSRSEFEFSFNKNKSVEEKDRRKDLDGFLKLYIDYKLKAHDAKRARMDTLISFKDEYATYRNFQLMPYLIDTAYVDSVAFDFYSKIKKNVGDADFVRVAHIFLKLPQKVSLHQKEVLSNRMDSIYSLLSVGKADFGYLASKFSDDKSNAHTGGVLPWIGPNSTLKEFEDIAYSLKKNEISKPFLSTAGFHIVKMLDRAPLGTYSELKNKIVGELEEQGLMEYAFESNVKKMIENAGEKMTREDIFNETEKRVASQDLNLKYLLKEYYEGLLVLGMREKTIEESDKTDKDLARYFKLNKSKYKWSEPRFKGYIIQVKDKKNIAKVKKILKRADPRNVKSILDKEFNNSSTAAVKVQYYFLKKGEDNCVDKFVFKVNSDFQMEYPYVDVFGKRLKNPKTYDDVLTQLILDYQNSMEEDWVNSLRHKERQNIQINQDVLKTVNQHN